MILLKYDYLTKEASTDFRKMILKNAPLGLLEIILDSQSMQLIFLSDGVFHMFLHSK